MKRALAYILGALTSPRQAFTLIAFDAQGLVISFLCLVAAAIAWALAALGLGRSPDSQPWAFPWIAIPVSEYYFWQALFAIPVILAAWMLVAGFVQLGSQRSGGGGSFEATAKRRQGGRWSGLYYAHGAAKQDIRDGRVGEEDSGGSHAGNGY